MKTCTKCGQSLPATREFFHLHGPTPDGFKPRCKSCRRAEEQERYVTLPDKAGRIARVVEWGRQNPEKRARYTRQWDREHPDLKHTQRSDTRARQAGTFVERVDRRVVFERDLGICGICGLAVRRQDVSVDHIIPLSRGGLHAYTNVQLAHRRCNAGKRDRLVPSLTHPEVTV